MKATTCYRLSLLAAYLLPLHTCVYAQGKFFGGDASGFAWAEAAEVLPVVWLDVAAEPAVGGIELRWKTASEDNNDFFIVQRSSPGTPFVSIGKVKGGGTLSTVSAYSFHDHSPLPGRNYYRITQVDYDGTSRHSAVVSADFEPYQAKYYLYPNPASGVFSTYPPVEEAVVSIFCMDGTLVEVFEGGAPFSVAGLKPAVYIVKLETPGAVVSLKLVVR